MAYRWKPSQTRKWEFVKKMREIEDYCAKENISHSKFWDSFYFTIGEKNYRVSNHTVASSNANGAYAYHIFGEKEYSQCITASKTRIIEIHQALKAGKTLDRRGNVIA